MKSNSQFLMRLTLAVAVLIPTVSVAQTESMPTDCAEDPDCWSLSESATQQSLGGNLSEALRLYQAAYDRLADPRLLFNIARIHHKQKQYAEAITHYQQYLESSLSATEQKRKASEYLALCQAELTEQSKSSQVPLIEKPSEVEPPPSETLVRSKPIYTKWWFWLGVGGFAAAGITTGVILGTRPTVTSMVRERMIPTNTLMFSF